MGRIFLMTALDHLCTQFRDEVPNWVLAATLREINGNLLWGWKGVFHGPRREMVVEAITPEYDCIKKTKYYSRLPIVLLKKLDTGEFVVAFHFVKSDSERTRHYEHSPWEYYEHSPWELKVLEELNAGGGMRYRLKSKEYRYRSDPMNHGEVEVSDSHHHQRFAVLSEGHKSKAAAERFITALNKEHIIPIIEAEKARKIEGITAEDGADIKTRIGGRREWDRKTRQVKEYESSPARVGDYVVYHDKKFRGWIFKIVEENLNNHYHIKIKPVFCGIEQVNFTKRQMSVSGADIEHVDLVPLGRAFQVLREVIEQGLARKSA